MRCRDVLKLSAGAVMLAAPHIAMVSISGCEGTQL